MIELLIEAERALSFGLLDRAEQLYRQVATNDPKNAIAVVGLARVALERGDDLGAYLHGRKAIAIEPENESARRLVERLEEVMRTRGDDVPELPEIPRRPSVVPPSMAPSPPGSGGRDRSAQQTTASARPPGSTPGSRGPAPGPAQQPGAARPSPSATEPWAAQQPLAPEPGDATASPTPTGDPDAAPARSAGRGRRRSLLDRLRRR